MIKNKRVLFLLNWMLIFVLSILVRLPNFLSKNFFFDGDEAIIGIMAQDLLNGENFPLYFYGQNYGFSTIEVFSTAFFEAILGASIWSLKLGGLLIFSLGVTIVYKTIQQYQLKKWMIFLLILLLVTFPSWYLWGTKVRGGYVTAFLFVCLIFYIIFKKQKSKSDFFVLCVSTVMAYESHLMMLIPFVPLLLFWLLQQNKPLHKIILFTFFSLLGIITFKIIRLFYPQFWLAPSLRIGITEQWMNLKSQLQGFISGFSNFEFFSSEITPPNWWSILLKILLISIFIFFILNYLKMDRIRKRKVYFMLVATILYLGLMSTIDLKSPRYWIGLSNGILFSIILIVIKNPSSLSKVFLVVFTVISFVGISVGSKMKQHWLDLNINEMKALDGFYQEVKRRDVKAIYITDNLLQYQWNYLYGNEIPASMLRTSERTQKFCKKVNEIYKKNPESVVLGGYWGLFLTMDLVENFNHTREQIEVEYFINTNSSKEIVKHGMDYVKQQGG